jgi:hypothetical protein
MRTIRWWALWWLAGCSGGVTLEGDGATDRPSDVPVDGVVEDGGPDGPGEDTATDADDGGIPPGCEPQDARAEGPCAAIVPGVAWNGTNCAGLGSGCGCVGADCGSVYDTVEACVEARRSCYPADCAPQPVSDDLCRDCDHEEFLGAFWDGRGCYELRGCRCRGAGCEAPFRSVPECEAVRSDCPATRCAATGGAWFPEETGGCGFACGGLRDVDCLVPFADCLCPDGKTFDRETGCVEDPTCTMRDRCAATAGRFYPASDCVCGFHCGLRGACDACLDSCDCGPHRNFDEALGCVPDGSCPAAEQAAICNSTGGTWGDYGCGHPYCGIPNMTDPCVMPGCDCGGGANFDPAFGCVPDPACFVRGEGEECRGHGTAWSTCRSGLACCSECGMWPGCSYCRTPCCPEGGGCESTGCPPPPP